MPTVQYLLERFAVSKTPGAMVLRGRWGVGKTYLWKHRVLPEVLTKPWKTRYSYVSLFGIGSLPELKVALAVATEEFNYDAEKRRNPIRRFWRFLSGLRRKLNRGQPLIHEAAASIPAYGDAIARAATLVGFYKVRNRIICFDDVERKGDGLSIKDFLGMVSYLAEERGCRVLVISNLDSLPASECEVWERSKEKVFTSEVEFRPPPEEQVALALVPFQEAPWALFLRSAFGALELSNFRLVERACRFMCQIEEVPDANATPEMWERIARVVALLVYASHGRGDGGPPLDRVWRRRSLNPIASGSVKDERSSDEVRWDKLIERQALYLRGTLDEAISELVQFGVPDNAKIRAGMEQFRADCLQREKEASFTKAWDSYHRTLNDNPEEIIEAIERTWPPVSATQTVGNLLSVVSVLRTVGQSGLARCYMLAWVEERQGDRRAELSHRELNRFRPITDPEFLGIIARTLAQPEATLNLDVALQLVLEETERDSAYESVSSAGQEAVAKALLKIDDTDLGSKIAKILAYRSVSPTSRAQTSRVLHDACVRIAESSDLAADRLRNWIGLDLTMVQSRYSGDSD